MNVIATNKRARFDYFLEKRFSAGVVLEGTEVKAVREGRVNINGSYARVVAGEVFVYDVFIGEYSKTSIDSHNPDRRRKLLLKKREIAKIRSSLQEQSMTLVPVRMFFSDRNFVKIELALARGKSKRDKRESMKKREASRRIQDAMGR